MAVDGDYPAMAWRQRALVLLLAIATAVGIWLMLVYRPGDPKHEALRAAHAARAASAASAAGVGGKAQVMLLPSTASAPR